MAAPKGNNYWLKRSSHGSKPQFATPEKLWEAAVEYFEYVGSNPFFETKPMVVAGVLEDASIARPRPFTIDGLTLFLDITDQGYRNYRVKEDFVGVTEAIDKTIRSQKLEGAAAGLFNANIIARDLGLKDANTTELSGPNGKAIEHDHIVTFEFNGVGPDD